MNEIKTKLMIVEGSIHSSQLTLSEAKRLKIKEGHMSRLIETIVVLANGSEVTKALEGSKVMRVCFLPKNMMRIWLANKSMRVAFTIEAETRVGVITESL